MSVVGIPAYQPDEQLVRLVDELCQNDFSVLVINDGSDKECDGVFEAVSKKAAVIHSEQNEGKGAALKKGFKALLEHYPDCTEFITADADGQHTVEDIIRVREQLLDGKDFVLTVRQFEGKMPARSKFGNTLSKIVYTTMNGHYFDDNQSGLRGFAVKHLEWLTVVKGDKYDYEMNMLCFADKQGIKIHILPIRAIYLDGNRSSHFNPVLDTVRIYKRLFFSVWPSLFSILLWELLTLVFSIVFEYQHYRFMVPTAVMVAAAINFMLQRFIVFRKVKYKDGLRTLLFCIIRATVYTGVVETVGAFTHVIPMFLVVNIAAVVMLFVEYQVHKKMHRLKK